MPDSAEAHFFLAEALARSGQLERANQSLEKSVEVGPSYLPARVGEIKMLVNNGDKESAKQAIFKLKNDFGDLPEVLGIEGWFLMMNGDYAAAADRFSSSLKKKPDTEVVLWHAQAVALDNKPEEALKIMQLWLESHPKDIDVLMHLAGTNMSLNNKTQARNAYLQVLKYHPNHVPALNNLAWLMREDDLSQAIGYAEQAYNLQPNSPMVQDTLGVLLLDDGNLSQGYKLIEEAAESAPGDLDIQIHLATALMLKKRYKDASEILDSIVKRAPNTRYAAEAKKLLETDPK
jgi:Flp pilus assembly protein TadD